MSLNKKQLGKDTRDAKRTIRKQDGFSKDVIVDPKGQWAHPGEITRIPGNQITMRGVPYPVLGIDDQGNEQMMFPGQDYLFPGNYVTEYPQLQLGGESEFIETELDDDQIAYYRSLGYRVEEIE